ncbi:MAG: NAD(+)/NADH kinase [Bacteroidales bacterium]|nr:NAD(+)/NADH kinase [Bacteroidales bacterium]
MKIALYYRHIDPADQAAFDELTATLRDKGIATVTVHDGDTIDACDYLFSIGGDGTLLSSVQFVRSSNPGTFPPVLGINFGHLGFLTTVGRENLHSMVDELLEGRFSLEERTLLEVNGQWSLNEVFVHRTEEASLLRTQVYVDGQYVATYAGDGVIVATPTGSTAYSLSCGGPILTPDSRCLVITPISAHTLTLRPIIVPDTAAIRLHICDSGFLGIDSRRSTLGPDCDLTLRRAPFTIRLIRMNTQNFFSAIRDKLMWGSEVRQ